METQEVFREKLVSYIQDAYAMENEIAQVLKRQIDVSGDQPEVQAKLRQHLVETEEQRERMKLRLAAYDVSPSVIKGAASTVLGNVVGLTGAIRPDMLSRTMRDDYATEHMEIASYTLLIAAARAYGDDETARVAELSLREEVAMATWIYDHLAMACYRDLEKQGVTLPGSLIQDAKVKPAMRVTFEPAQGLTAPAAERGYTL